MKNKLLSDSIVYIISPVILLSFINYSIIKYLVAVLVFILSIYTIKTKIIESRINVSGILFFIIYTLIVLFRIKVQQGFNMYIYDTCWMIVLDLIISLSLLVNKNIFKQIYIDIRRCKNDNNLRIFNNIKKFSLDNYFKNISLLFTFHLLSLISIRVVSIYIYSISDYTSNSIIEILFNIVFIICEICMVFKFIDKLKADTKIKKQKSSSISSRVIYIEQYKNINK